MATRSRLQGHLDIAASLHQLQLYRKFVAVGCRSFHISWVNAQGDSTHEVF